MDGFALPAHRPADDESRGDYQKQAKRHHHEARPVALAMEFGGQRLDGIRRDGSTTGGTETPAFDPLAAVATKHHICYEGYAVSKLAARTWVQVPLAEYT